MKSLSPDAQIAQLSADLANASRGLTEANAAIARLTGERDRLLTEATILKAREKTSCQRAAEIAAAAGCPPVTKSFETPGLAASGDLKAIYERYARLDGREAAEFWDKHEKELHAYAAQCEREPRHAL